MPDRLPNTASVANSANILAMLPLTPAVFHIILALASGDRHGYGIRLEVQELTGGQIVLGPGTLYRSLQKMLVDGLIAEVAAQALEAPDQDDERRRYYRLTELGRRAGEAEAARLDLLVRAARARNLLSDPLL